MPRHWPREPIVGEGQYKGQDGVTGGACEEFRRSWPQHQESGSQRDDLGILIYLMLTPGDRVHCLVVGLVLVCLTGWLAVVLVGLIGCTHKVSRGG